MHEAIKNIKWALLSIFHDQNKPKTYFADKLKVNENIIRRALDTNRNTGLQVLVDLTDALDYQIEVTLKPKDPESLKTHFSVVLSTTPMEVGETLNPVEVE